MFFATGFDVATFREEFKVQKGTLLLVKLGTFYGQGIRTMSALAKVNLTEARLVMMITYNHFCP